MVQLRPGKYNANDQPVDYNPTIWSVFKEVAEQVGGAAYVINIPMNTNASQTTDMRNILGSTLDSMLLANEPDLYHDHGKRPNLKNYTVDNYFGEYSDALKTIGAGDSAGQRDIGGPSICCNWDLRTLLQQGYLTKFSTALKYIALQHYPQNNCFGSFKYQMPYYLQHNEVVTLAQWQKPGIDYLLEQPAENRPQLMNSEFNSASCGGVPFSPSFAVGSLWSIDYALQMAAVGYSQAYIHTREAGISYNLLAPPPGPAGSAGAWTTNAPYYALLVMAEGLLTDAGGIVQDLNLGDSMSNPKATSSAYAVYNARNKTVSRLIIFNYGNDSTEFALPGSVFSSAGNAAVKFLHAPTPQETTQISWGGETWGPGVSDGKTTLKPDWATPNVKLTGCTSGGCSFTAPGPSLSMVFFDNAQSADIATNSSTGNTPKGAGGATMSLNASLSMVLGGLVALVSMLALGS
ncbi:hypothetical protein B0H15DRAFT_814656 [Mycena belliarum]|uniref:Beta-glucuronidase C-terminal domain-containing protein n=1 Tax=Mycena belliarum TaxID=1033014 RepID=A0AAD6UJI0_9AGAR|nr:hypothetical protein B0H15DRAFT_814656 [Mycena belliae]